MNTTISWDRYTGQVLENGWYVCIIRPSNWQECLFNHISCDDWIYQFGFNLLWYNEGVFWQDKIKINDRVLYYAKRPNITLE